MMAAHVDALRTSRAAAKTPAISEAEAAELVGAQGRVC